MAKDDAESGGSSDPWRHAKVVSGKGNLAAQDATAQWIKMRSVELPNGDNVGVVTSWHPPDAVVGPSEEEIAAVVEAAKGGRTIAKKQGWVGKLSNLLRVEIEACQDRK